MVQVVLKRLRATILEKEELESLQAVREDLKDPISCHDLHCCSSITTRY
jgi:hypothetical protein